MRASSIYCTATLSSAIVLLCAVSSFVLRGVLLVTLGYEPCQLFWNEKLRNVIFLVLDSHAQLLVHHSNCYGCVTVR